MNPNDLHRLWNDAIDDVPTEAVAEQMWQHVQQGLRTERRRRFLVRTTTLAAVGLAAVSVWLFRPTGPEKLADNPAPQPTAPVAQSTAIAPIDSTATSPMAPTPTEAPTTSAQVVVNSLPLKEFLAQLPHHGVVEIKNERGRFLFVTDHETGETFTATLSPDDKL